MTTLSSQFKPARIIFLAISSLFVYLIVRFVIARLAAPINFDEEYTIWGGWLMTQGGVPYRDFFEPKPPVVFFVNYWALSLFGYDEFSLRILPSILALISLGVFLLSLVRRKIIAWVALMLAAQAGLWLLGPEFHDSGLNDSETYGFAFVLMGFSIGSLAGSTPSRSRKLPLQLLSGVFFGLAVFSKELFIFSVAPAWLLAARNGDNGGWDWRHLFFSALGSVTVLGAFLIYLVSHSAFGPYLDLIGFYRSFAANYGIDIGRFPRVSGLSVILPSLSILHGVLYNFKDLAFVIVLWSALALWIFGKTDRVGKWIDIVIALLAILLGMIAISIGHCFWRHYYLMGATGLVLLSVLGADAVSEFLAKRSSIVSLVTFSCLSVSLFFVGRDTTKTVLQQPVTYQERAWAPSVVRAINEHSNPGDYILTTEGPLIYVAMNRKAPLGLNFFVDEILPYVTADNRFLKMEILRANLEKNLPKVCYFPGWLRPRQDEFHKLLFAPLLAKHHYVKISESLWYLPAESK